MQFIANFRVSALFVSDAAVTRFPVGMHQRAKILLLSELPLLRPANMTCLVKPSRSSLFQRCPHCST
jgi:hypothetical protein